MDFKSLQKEEVFSFDTKKWPFREYCAAIFDGWSDLETVHEALKEETRMITYEWDQKTDWHTKYYNSDKLDALLELYHRFVVEELSKQFEDDVIIFQRKPTFRVHLPNNTAIPSDKGTPDKPGLHRDSDYNHPTCEINYWLPFTYTTENNTMWTESEEDKGDYHPVLMKYGECFRFYGSKVWHYNKVNTDPTTRVSVDFRVCGASQWDKKQAGRLSVQQGKVFDIGQYYIVYDKVRNEVRETLMPEGQEDGTAASGPAALVAEA